MSVLLEIGLVVGSLLVVVIGGWRLAHWWLYRNPCVCGHGGRDHSATPAAYCEAQVRRRNAAGRSDWRRCNCRGYRKPGTPEPLTPEEEELVEQTIRRYDPTSGNGAA